MPSANLVRRAVNLIRLQTDTPLYLYTARPDLLPEVLPFFDGFTVTLHTKESVRHFSEINADLKQQDISHLSLRLKAFKQVTESLKGIDTSP